MWTCLRGLQYFYECEWQSLTQQLSCEDMVCFSKLGAAPKDIEPLPFASNFQAPSPTLSYLKCPLDEVQMNDHMRSKRRVSAVSNHSSIFAWIFRCVTSSFTQEKRADILQSHVIVLGRIKLPCKDYTYGFCGMVYPVEIVVMTYLQGSQLPLSMGKYVSVVASTHVSSYDILFITRVVHYPQQHVLHMPAVRTCHTGCPCKSFVQADARYLTMQMDDE